MTVWVDDLSVFTEKGEEMKTHLKSVLDINDLGEPRVIIGLEVDRPGDRTAGCKPYLNTVGPKCRPIKVQRNRDKQR
jgi:hypothetical protein